MHEYFHICSSMYEHVLVEVCVSLCGCETVCECIIHAQCSYALRGCVDMCVNVGMGVNVCVCTVCDKAYMGTRRKIVGMLWCAHESVCTCV
jgi:hypothetical protein